MSGLFGSDSSGGGIAGNLPTGVKLAAVALLAHQLMKHAQPGQEPASPGLSGGGGGLGGLLGGLMGQGSSASAAGSGPGGGMGGMLVGCLAAGRWVVLSGYSAIFGARGWSGMSTPGSDMARTIPWRRMSWSAPSIRRSSMRLLVTRAPTVAPCSTK